MLIKIIIIVGIILLALIVLFALGLYNVGKDMHYYRSCGHNERSDL